MPELWAFITSIPFPTWGELATAIIMLVVLQPFRVVAQSLWELILPKTSVEQAERLALVRLHHTTGHRGSIKYCQSGSCKGFSSPTDQSAVPAVVSTESLGL